MKRCLVFVATVLLCVSTDPHFISGPRYTQGTGNCVESTPDLFVRAAYAQYDSHPSVGGGWYIDSAGNTHTDRSVSVGTAWQTGGASRNLGTLSGSVYSGGQLLANGKPASLIQYGSGTPSGTPAYDLYIDILGGFAWVNASGVWSRLGTADHYVDPVGGDDSTGTGSQSRSVQKFSKVGCAVRSRHGTGTLENV